MEKISKRQYFTAIVTGNREVTIGEETVVITDEMFKAFAAHEIELLDNRAAKAKETKAKKAAEPDLISDAVEAALTDEFQTAADIVAAIANPDITAAKAVYRLNALAEAGVAIKEDIKIEGQRNTRKGYKRA